MRKLGVLLLLLVLAASAAVGQIASTPGIAGIYRVNVQWMYLIVKILPGAPRAQWVGVVLDVSSQQVEQLKEQTFLELNQGPDGKYVGRFRPQFTGNSWNPEEWWPAENGWLDAQGNLTFSDVTSAGRAPHTFYRIHLDARLRDGSEPDLAGRYRYEQANNYCILEVRPGGVPLYEWVGVMVEGSAGFQRYVGGTYLRLNKVGANAYWGQESLLGHPYFMVNRANVTESGDLRVQVVTSEGEAPIIFRRERGAGAGSQGAQPGSGGGGGGGGGGNPRVSSGSGTNAPPPTQIPMNAGAWQQVANFVGAMSNAQQGLFLQGAAFTNGRLVNGAYDGNRVQSREVIDLSSGGDIFAAFAANGAGAYMVFWPRLLTGIAAPAFSTHHSWNSSIVVPDLTWMFGHLRVEPGGAYQFTVSSGTYDVQGGTPIYQGKGRLANPAGRVDFQFMDNYAGVQASMMIGEVWVVHDGGGTVPPQPGPAPGPGPQARPGGAQCSAPNECDSGICLLGVCAPKSQ